MKMQGAVGPTPLDAAPGLVGQPMDRVDGRLKVTGGARYSHEVAPPTAPLYGVMVPATVAKGTITAINADAVRAMPGVRLVLTHENASPQEGGNHRRACPVLVDAEVISWGQPIALVVADTFEQARAGALALKPSYRDGGAETSLHEAADKAKTPGGAGDGSPKPDSSIGDLVGAMQAAPVKLDLTYTTPLQSHAMMEPHATVAHWEGDRLVLQNANQMVSQGQAAVAHTLKMPKEKVRLISTFVGGGFGGKLWVEPDAILAAIASQQTGRPVKVALTRPQVFTATTNRSDTVQRIRLAAQQDGTLLAIGHDTLSGNRTDNDAEFEGASLQTRVLYAAPNRLTRHRLAELNRPVSSSMRAPGEAVGMLAIECAMDELAEQLGMDPIALRLKNEPAEDPERKIPFSSRNLVACLNEGARRFGWDKRGRPGERTEGRWLLGMGVSSAIRNSPLRASKALVRLDPDGTATVQMAMTDIGTGTYTILTQIAGSLLGLPAAKVRVQLADSDYPMAAGSGGSFGAASSGSALYDACMTMREKLAGLAGMDAGSARFADGRIMAADGSAKALGGLVPAAGLVVEGSIEPGDNLKHWSEAAYGAQFAEVGVDRDSGEVRLRRMLGVFAAGRVLNAKTARSQAIGGMIFGVGAALEEEVAMDTRFGNFVNANLAEYHVPVHADIPAIDAVFLTEVDDKTNPLKSKGVGELGISGAGSAIANAVFNASGVRVRDYPLTLDKVMLGMDRRQPA